jgi:hypothetical protein
VPPDGTACLAAGTGLLRKLQQGTRGTSGRGLDAGIVASHGRQCVHRIQVAGR